MKVKNTNDVGKDQLKMLIFGESGSGKTTLAKTIKEPTIIISAESGLLSIAGSGIDVIDITLDDEGKLLSKDKRIERLQEAYLYLLTPEAKAKYKWVFVDSLTEINSCMFDKLRVEFPDLSDNLKLYGQLAQNMRSLIKSFRDLPQYNVVLVALSAIDKDENNKRFIGVDLIGKIAGQVNGYFDEVLYLHVDPENENKRVLITGKTEKINCKDRSGRLAFKEEADLSAITTKIRG